MTEDVQLEKIPLKIRRATLEDAKRLFEWRNDPETRKQSRATDPVSWDGHLQWLQNSFKNPKRILAIAETVNGEPVGTVRADIREDGFAEISYTIAPLWRGKGMSKPMAVGFARAFLQGRRIAANIKKGHGLSESVARALGLAPFSETPSDDSNDPRPMVEWR